METGQTGCLLCGATWGDYWEVVDGKKLFFCCEVCATDYKTIITEARKRRGWASVDSLEMEGDRRGRTCTAKLGRESYRFMVSFFDDGRLRTFVEL
jgi:putative zinc binding protein